MRPLASLAWFALAPLLSGCEAGLDLRTPSDAREYVRLCALGRDDIYCEAMLPTLKTVQGPVTVIMPNTGDDDRLRLLTALLAARGMTVAAFRQDAALQAAFARANVFPLERLITGTHHTLDGRAHEVVCEEGGVTGRRLCRIGPLRGWNSMEYAPAAVGAVYVTVGETPADLPFFPF